MDWGKQKTPAIAGEGLCDYPLELLEHYQRAYLLQFLTAVRIANQTHEPLLVFSSRAEFATEHAGLSGRALTSAIAVRVVFGHAVEQVIHGLALVAFTANEQGGDIAHRIGRASGKLLFPALELAEVATDDPLCLHDIALDASEIGEGFDDLLLLIAECHDDLRHTLQLQVGILRMEDFCLGVCRIQRGAECVPANGSEAGSIEVPAIGSIMRSGDGEGEIPLVAIQYLHRIVILLERQEETLASANGSSRDDFRVQAISNSLFDYCQGTCIVDDRIVLAHDRQGLDTLASGNVLTLTVIRNESLLILKGDFFTVEADCDLPFHDGKEDRFENLTVDGLHQFREIVPFAGDDAEHPVVGFVYFVCHMLLLCLLLGVTVLITRALDHMDCFPSTSYFILKTFYFSYLTLQLYSFVRPKRCK